MGNIFLPQKLRFYNIERRQHDHFVHNPAGGPQIMKDAAPTIDMAKEICMIQRSEKGKQARQIAELSKYRV